MSKMKAVITLFAVLAVLVGVSTYVANNAEAQLPDLPDDPAPVELAICSLMLVPPTSSAPENSIVRRSLRSI